MTKQPVRRDHDNRELDSRGLSSKRPTKYPPDTAPQDGGTVTEKRGGLVRTRSSAEISQPIRRGKHQGVADSKRPPGTG
jgi:hypothetical protein